MIKRLVVGNWKMNPVANDSAIELAKDIDGAVAKLNLDNSKVEAVICPPFTEIEEIARISRASIAIGAQDAWPGESGAFTGEVSMGMLAKIDIDYVILGHSERRRYQNETSEVVNQKLKSALKYNITPIVCVGESEKGQHELVTKQLIESVKGLTSEEINKIVIAYEPVWAIGTGDNADGNYVVDVLTNLRTVLNNQGANQPSVPILYGGSVNAKNATEYASRMEINGVLVGGASINAEEFIKIIKAFS